MSCLPLCGCAVGRGLKPSFPAKAAIVFTSDSSYEDRSYPKYSLQSRLPSRAGTN